MRIETFAQAALWRAIGLLSFVASLLASPVALANVAPTITSTPPPVASVARAYAYRAAAADPERDVVAFGVVSAPAGFAYDAASQSFVWTPTAADVGTKSIVIRATDSRGAETTQAFALHVTQDFCALYPIALPDDALAGASPGQVFNQLPRGVGPGNFGWLSWSGVPTAKVLAASLVPPGDSHTYVNPDDESDHLPEPGDWVSGGPGSMSSKTVRDRLDELLAQDIVVPSWGATRERGKGTDFRVQRFATVRLIDYRISGRAWLSFEFRGFTSCYNQPPQAHDGAASTPAGAPVAISLSASDPEADALTFRVVDPPQHGQLSGVVGATVVYTPDAGYVGPDGFRFVANDGELDSAPATVTIGVLHVNHPPTIVSTPPLAWPEHVTYAYDVDALDPDGDALSYGLDQGPAGATVDPGSGLLSSSADAAHVQSVQAFNAQCYVVPPDSAPAGDGLYIAPLYQRVRSAITHGSAYTAVQTRAWDTANGCLGCHVQTQTLLGLQASKDKAEVDEGTAEFLLSKILTSQQADGSIRLSHPEFAGNQTAFALWALSYVPDRARTLDARRRGLDYFWVNRRNVSPGRTSWWADHGSGWLSNTTAMTALVALTASRYLTDVGEASAPTAEQLATAQKYQAVLPDVAAALIADTVYDASYSLYPGMRLLALGELRAHVGAPAPRAAVDAELARLDALLRSRQRPDGGWAYVNGGPDDPLSTAWVGFGLNALKPAPTDPVVRKTIEYLLSKQQPDGTWISPSNLFGTRLAPTGLVMAYLPVALEHLGNADLALGHLTLGGPPGDRSLTAQVLNRGLADVTATVRVTFYNGPPSGGDVLGELALDGLASKALREVTLALGPRTPDADVYAHVAADAPIDECLTDNNGSVAALVRVSATDPGGLSDGQAYLLNVDDENDPPTIASSPVTTLEQGKPYGYQVRVEDPDVGDAHLFTITSGPVGLYIDEHDGRFSYDSAALTPGNKPVTVRVRDLRGASAAQSFTLSVLANRPPVITSAPVLVASVGAPYHYTIKATDPDGDALVYTVVQSPLTLSVDAASGEISWTPAPSQVGNQTVTLKVSDGRSGVATQTFTVAVAANHAPVITSTPNTEATAGEAYVYDFTALDEDGDALSYHLGLHPDGMVIDASSGRVSWTPTAAEVGYHDVEVRAADSRGAGAAQAFVLHVGEANRAPIFTSTPPTTAHVGETYRYEAAASDLDAGDSLSFALVQAPAGMSVASTTGLVVWSPTAAQLGAHAVALRVSDGRGGAATQSFSVEVNPAGANHAPTIHSTPPAVARPSQVYQYAMVASDADGDVLAYALTQAPVGMAIDPSSGLVTWTPPAAALGVHAVAVRVSDGRGGAATQTFSVLVTNETSNQPPHISSAPVTAAKVAHEYRYDLQASDADGDALTYTLQQGPAGMTIDPATGLVRWTPEAAGTAAVRVRAADALSWADQQWTITVAAANVPLQAHVTVTPASVGPGDPITVTVTTNGTAGNVTAAATLDGLPIAIDPNGSTTVVAPAAFGVHTIAVTVSDGVDSAGATATFGVVDPSDTTPPEVRLLAPLDNAEITAPVEVRGTVADAQLQSWVLVARPSHSPDVPPTVLAQGTTNVTDGVLGRFDPTRLMNGQYSLILQATDAGAHVTADSIVVRVTGDLKVGNFSLTFEDVSIPVAGIPVRVTRTYDTRRRDEKLDFGRGWSVDYQNVRVHESQAAGYAWQLQKLGSGFNTRYCVLSSGPRTVSVTLPDGKVETFRAKAEPECTPLIPQVDVNLVFQPDGDTSSTLEQLDYGTVRVATVAGIPGSNLIDLGAPDEPVDPSHYRLTTREGLVYELDQNFGVRTVRDPSGNTLTYSAAGVVHSSGVAVSFARDSQGRIRQITLPDGSHLGYEFDAAGDLVTFNDALAQPTRFAYEAQLPHYLKDIVDPRGVRVTRNEYDDAGRLLATIDADGRRIEFTHDVDGRTEQVRDRRGNLTTYLYDDRGRVLAETNALGETTRRTYDAHGNELSRTDALGHTTTSTYDAYGNKLTEINALGETTISTYDAHNQLLTQVDSAGRAITASTYDPLFYQMSSSRDALGNAVGFGYDHGLGSAETGELTSITDPNGATTRFSVNAKGQRTSSTDPLGHVTSYTYDPAGRVTAETTTRTDASGTAVSLVTRHTYDAKGRRTSTQLPDGSTSTIEYNPIDKPSKRCDALNRCTLYAYDARGNLTETTHPDGSRERKTYDANGNLASETDRAGRVTRHVYDAANRRISTISPDDTPADDSDNPFTVETYDAAGRLTASTDPRGNVTSFGYDALGRRTSVTDALGNTTTTAYDSSGRQSQVTDALGRITAFHYDEAGKLTGTTYDDGSSVSAEYDAAGRKLAEIDAAGRATRYAYDAVGRLSAVFLPNPQTGANPPPVGGASPDAGVLITRYAYDEQGNRVSQTDALGRVTRWSYDHVGRPLTRTLPLGQTESFTYDAAGRRVAHTDFRGVTTLLSYHANTDWVAGIDYPTKADVALAYTPTGQLRQVADGNGTTTYERDARDRLTRVTWPSGQNVEYRYDAAGNRVQLKTANQTVDYSFDALNRLSGVRPQGEAADAASYSYDAVGNRAAVTYANGTRSDYGYNRLNRLTSIAHKAGVNLLLGLAYTLDPIGLRTAVDETGATARHVEYDYDAVRRVTSERVSAADGDRTTTWAYDAVGNRLTQTRALAGGSVTTSYSYDANDRLNSEQIAVTGAVPGATPGEVSYDYDAAGNLTRKLGPAGVELYAYDDANRLAELTALNGEVTRYAYAHDGTRLSQTTRATDANPVTTHYLFDPNQAHAQVLEESTQQGGGIVALSAVYTFGQERLRQLRPATPGNPGAPASLRYYHADGLGSTRLLTDEAAALTDRYAYEAFGEIDASATSASTPNDFLFAGEQRDPNSDLYYLRARYMAPQAGRFTQQDVFPGRSGAPPSLHRYNYTEGNPVNWVDPTGWYTAEFGGHVERYVEEHYEASHPQCIATPGTCQFGERQYFDAVSYLKPDIMNFATHEFNEIKPLSPSGIAKGKVQLALYISTYGVFGFQPDVVWMPPAGMVDGQHTDFVNLSGLIFYTDDSNMKKELAAMTIATAAMALKRSASLVATRLGADAVLQAALSRGVATVAASNTARLQTSVSLSIFLF